MLGKKDDNSQIAAQLDALTFELKSKFDIQTAELKAKLESDNNALIARLEAENARLESKLDAVTEQLNNALAQVSRQQEFSENVMRYVHGRLCETEIEIYKAAGSILFEHALKNNIDELRNPHKIVLQADTLYDEGFYDHITYMAYYSAKKVLPWFLAKYISVRKLSSIVDFGCGTGAWLSVANMYEQVVDIQGVDGDYVNRDRLLIDPACFKEVDLCTEINLNKKYDLAISLEVGEHIDEQYTDIYLDNICRHADVVLFSAAHPGQGGVGHVNEQPKNYWIEKFMAKGYLNIDISKHVGNNLNLEYCYRTNLTVFVKEEMAEPFIGALT